MIAFPAGVKVWIAGGVTDMRCGMNSLALKVQEGLGRDPYGGEVFCFRGRKGDLIKVLWHDGVGMSLYLKRLEAGKFIWPVSQNGSAVPVSSAQLQLSPGRDRLAQPALDAAAQADRLHSSVFVGLSTCSMVAFGHG
ncbi:IS66 family insertion sequence element accessory protein TnpB [Rhizobium esperanzae]|uniref:IS66 family insertion sequence element accessory protein TnpB n=1 Tax=Rhizobium esperanzae TaxID=1967781 RepID=UPI0026A84AA5